MRLGPEPHGATPLEDDELEGLIPDYVTTRLDLDRAEADNINSALPDARRLAKAAGPEGVLCHRFLMDLHRRMFRNVWKWAGKQRVTEKNIGVDPALVAESIKRTFDDATFWHEHGTYPRHEVAVRIHHTLVWIHPFPNGNGRCTRLIADLYLEAMAEPSLTWGGKSLVHDSEIRGVYMKALRAADAGSYAPLLEFVRR